MTFTKKKKKQKQQKNPKETQHKLDSVKTELRNAHQPAQVHPGVFQSRIQKLDMRF